MRIIKFRGKRVDNGEWVYGSLRTDYLTKEVENGGCVCYISNQSRYSRDFNLEQVHPETVGQYTGLIDRNGKEIYEGDLLSANFVSAKNLKAIHCIMTFNEATACFEAQQYWANQDKWLSLSSGHNYYLYEIIGNIHDNT